MKRQKGIKIKKHIQKKSPKKWGIKMRSGRDSNPRPPA